MIARPARPPTTPPAIAPALDPDLCGEELVVEFESEVAGFAVGEDVIDGEEVDEVDVEVGFAAWVVPSLTKTPRPSLQQVEPNVPSPQQ